MLLTNLRHGLPEEASRFFGFSSKGNEVEELLKPTLTVKELETVRFLGMVPVRFRGFLTKGGLPRFGV